MGMSEGRITTEHSAGAEITEMVVNGQRVIDLRNATGQLCGRVYPNTWELEIKPKGGPKIKIELVPLLVLLSETGISMDKLCVAHRPHDTFATTSDASKQSSL